MIRKLEISGRQKRFDRELEQHSHIYCVQCQRVDNIRIAPDQTAASASKDSRGYKITGCRVKEYLIFYIYPIRCYA